MNKKLDCEKGRGAQSQYSTTPSPHYSTAAPALETLDAHSFRLENGLLRLVESLERKRDNGDWIDSMILRESNDIYDTEPEQTVRY